MAFDNFRDAGQRQDLIRERAARLAESPVTEYEYVTVVFSGGGTDVDIPHTLEPTDPEAVRWTVVSINADTSIYRDTSGTAKPWQTTHIWLRAGAACTARLMLFLERS